MIYLLFYDTNYGGREEWNTFYTPVEAFSTKELRDARKEALKEAKDVHERPCGYQFYELDIEVDNV